MNIVAEMKEIYLTGFVSGRAAKPTLHQSSGGFATKTKALEGEIPPATQATCVTVFNKVPVLKLKHFGGNMPHFYLIHSTPLKNPDLLLYKRRNNNNQRISQGFSKLLFMVGDSFQNYNKAYIYAAFSAAYTCLHAIPKYTRPTRTHILTRAKTS